MATGEDRPTPPPNAETIEMKPVTGHPALPERYEMIGELGRGGMGIVYQARDRETNEIVALKFLKPEIAADAQILERFRNEVRLSRKISHRNVARIHEFHRTGDSVYVSMEYVEGESLRALLQREGKLPVDRGLQLARQLIAGVGEAHNQSIVHRDLKPENIMVKPSGEVKVMDFGISKSYAAGVTSTGAVIGTPAYMAPEQAEGKPTDQRTDIYALGLILYEMFTGVAAFSGDTAVSVALKQIREMPPAPKTIAPGLPENLESAILKCLAKEPAKRFQSTDELLVELFGEKPATIQTSELTPIQTSKSRRKFWIAAIAGATAAFAGVLWMLRSPSDKVQFPIEQFTLANGLPVVLSVDHAAPIVSFSVSYKAGYRRDPAGRSGLALAVAHLMQQGSANVGAGEEQAVISEVGGNHNYGLMPDCSFFMSTLPANQLEMALFLEADRMRSLEITSAGLEAARGIVQGQYAAELGRPYGRAFRRMFELAFSNPVNQHALFGRPEDLQSFTIEAATEFYKTYYRPSNASLALVGDFDPAKARERIKHYFESIPDAKAPPAPDLTEPERNAVVRESFTDPSTRVPVILMIWKVPALLDRDWFTLKALMDLLRGNEASRLATVLVKGAGVATAIEGEMGNSAGLNTFYVGLIAAPGKDLGQLEKLALGEIDRLVREGVPEEEMQRLRTEERRSRAMELVTTGTRAIVFSQLMAAGSAPDAINQWEEGQAKLTSDELRRVAKQYLTDKNRTVVVVTPGGAK